MGADRTRPYDYHYDTNTGKAVPSGSSAYAGGDGDFGLRTGGTVTQATNRTNGVTLNQLSGKVTGDDASLNAVTIAKHTVTNSTVEATDVVILSKVSGDVDTSCWVDAVAAGSFDVAIRNNHASAPDTTAFVYNFVVVKGSHSS